MAKAKILIVEDEAIIAHDTKIKLEMEGYEVVAIVDTGEESIACTEKYKPDLVLMDIVLDGDMNGIEAAKKIRAEYKIPVLFLSAHSKEDMIEQAETSELYDYLVKPVSSEELLQAVKKSLIISTSKS